MAAYISLCYDMNHFFYMLGGGGGEIRISLETQFYF